MPRSDGSFPEFKRLDVDTEQPPGDYWEAGVNKCLICQVRWPKYELFESCVRCGTRTTSYQHEPEDAFGNIRLARPDMTWRLATQELLNHNFDALYTLWNEDASDEDLLVADFYEELSQQLD